MLGEDICDRIFYFIREARNFEKLKEIKFEKKHYFPGADDF